MFKSFLKTAAVSAVIVGGSCGVAFAQAGVDKWITTTDADTSALVYNGSEGETLRATCGVRAGYNPERVYILALAEAAGLQADTFSQFQIIVGPHQQQVDATLTEIRGPVYGTVVSTFNLNAPGIQALRTENQFSFGIPGRQFFTVQLTPARAKIQEFFQLCQNYLPAQTNAGGQQTPAAPANDEGFSIAEGIALGVVAGALGVIANEIDEQLFTEAPAPSAPTNGQGRMTTVQIASVEAVETTFGFGGDEVFLIASNGQRIPSDPSQYQSIDAGQTWTPNASLSAPGGVSIDLREWDSFNASDLIGNFSVDGNLQPGRYSSTLNGDGATYVVTYDVAVSGQTQQQPQQPSFPQQAPRVWSALGSNDGVTVADCRDDCEEDVGIVFECQGYGLPALVSIPWAAIERGTPGAKMPLSILVGNQRFSYEATLGNFGLVGHIPSIFINPNDPVIEVLQAGSVAFVEFAGGTVDIGLRGSRAALDVFKAQCDWNNVPFDAQFVDGQSDDGANWLSSFYQEVTTGRMVPALTFGIPETDAIGFSATCRADGGIETELLVDFGARADGAPVQTFIEVDGQAFGYQGNVFVSSSEWAGVEMLMNPRDPIWQRMQDAREISYGIVGGQRVTAPGRGAAAAISQFLADCQSASALGGGNQVAPTRPTLGGAPAQQPIQQTQQPTLGQQAVPQQVPVQQVPQQQPVQQNVPGTPVNYRCDDGSTMLVNISAVGAASVATVVRNDGGQFALIKVPTPVGEKYSNGEATLNKSGNTAQLIASGVSAFCQAG